MPLIKIEHIAEGITLGIWNATENTDFFLAPLPAGYLTGFDDKRFSERRKKEFLASRSLLKLLLDDAAISLGIKHNGQVALIGDPRNISISHSKDMVAVIVSNTYATGIDIEEINAKVKRITHKFLNEKEIKILGDKPELWKITLCWSAKESIYKMLGQTGLSFSNDIILQIPENEGAKKFKAMVKRDGVEKELAIYFERIDDFILTYVFDALKTQSD